MPFIIQCSASGSALGALLAQLFEDGEHLIIYASRTLTLAERNYSTTEREFRPYVEGYKFTAVTDHSALKWLRNLKSRRTVEQFEKKKFQKSCLKSIFNEKQIFKRILRVLDL